MKKLLISCVGILAAGVLSGGGSLYANHSHREYYDHPRHATSLQFNFGRNRGRSWGQGSYYAASRPPPVQRYVPGYYRTVARQVWVPAAQVRYWVEPVYQTVYRYGRPMTVQVSAGYYTIENRPGHFQTVSVEEWVPPCRTW